MLQAQESHSSFNKVELLIEERSIHKGRKKIEQISCNGEFHTSGLGVWHPNRRFEELNGNINHLAIYYEVIIYISVDVTQ